MSAVLAALAHHARHRPGAVALEGDGVALGYAELAAAVAECAARLEGIGTRVAALLLDNSPAWAVFDLALQQAGVAALPLPGFFSAGQSGHALAAAAADTLFCDRPEAVAGLPGWRLEGAWRVAGRDCTLLRCDTPVTPRLPAGTAKITFTSGTTGNPKGVCLSQELLDTVARSLGEAAAATAEDRHLATLPLATLLENVGGLYVPLLAGARALLPPLAEVGMSGASGLDPQRLGRTLAERRATSAILVPIQLQGLLAAFAAGLPRPAGLRYVAVGGAAVSPALLAEAAACGLPVHQGYGLSECGSVVAVNRPGEDRPGSVGKPLPHLRLELAGDGEVRVLGPRMLGYLGDDPGGEPPPGEGWATGDLGYLDDDGYLYLSGRKKNLFITAFGRNVAPEWVEAELTATPAILQAAVFGEARPWNAAVLFSPAPDAVVEAALAAANARLPDYARVHRWLRADAPFSPANGQATANGRPRREAIRHRYGERLETLYAN